MRDKWTGSLWLRDITTFLFFYKSILILFRSCRLSRRSLEGSSRVERSSWVAWYCSRLRAIRKGSQKFLSFSRVWSCQIRLLLIDFRFYIDLCCGLLIQGDHMDNKALHFNPRFDSGGSWWVINSCVLVVEDCVKGDPWWVRNTLRFMCGALSYEAQHF